MKRWLKYLPFLLVAVAALIWFVGRAPWVHRNVDAADVAQVQIRTGDSQEMTPASAEQAGQIVAWFNEAGSVKNNPSHAGPGCGEGHRVVIRLRSGEQISLWRAGERLHVNREGADYYFSQPNLLGFVKDLQQGKARCG